jgi:hypothetical protein
VRFLARDLEPWPSVRLGFFQKDAKMPDNHPVPVSEAGKQVQPHPHDTGSQANETTDGSDSTTEALRRAAEDTPTGVSPDDVEATPVFDRADLPPKI